MCRSISFRLSLLTFVICIGTTSWTEGASVVTPGDDTPIFETVHNSNAALFNRLGLSPLRISQGHHKKRLAGPEPSLNFASQNHQSYGRRHGHKDSHVYIVKLPPSPPYYAITKPHKDIKNDVKGVKKNSNFPVGFQSNGKPGGIYHWNLPVMKKMAEKKRLVEHRVQMQQHQQQQEKKQKVETRDYSNEIGKLGVLDSRFQSNAEKRKLATLGAGIISNDLNGANKHARNNDRRLNYGVSESSVDKKKNGVKVEGREKNANKNYRLDDSILYNIKLGQNDNHRLIWNAMNDPNDSTYANSQKQKKHRKKSAMSYYAPFSLKSGSTSLHKNFSGNGKPKAFYVIEKSRKPVYYHPLLP